MMLQLNTLLNRRRILPLGKSIHTVVFNDVHHGRIAANKMFKLPHPNAGCVTIAADAEILQCVVGKTGSCCE